MSNELTKSSASANGTGLTPTPAVGRKQIGLPGLMARTQQASKQRAAEPQVMPNRLALLLDCSGSMESAASYAPDSNGISKIEYLRRAYDAFTTQLDFSNTTLCVETFPRNDTSCCPPTAEYSRLMLAGMAFSAAGDTPLASAMNTVITQHSLTRAIIISDGDADSSSRALDEAKSFVQAEVPVDTIHIGSSGGGEELLKEIASLTKGIYVKFTDVEAFSRALSYLTPRYRGMLMSGEVSASALGAKEIRLLGGK